MRWEGGTNWGWRCARPPRHLSNSKESNVARPKNTFWQLARGMAWIRYYLVQNLTIQFVRILTTSRLQLWQGPSSHQHFRNTDQLPWKKRRSKRLQKLKHTPEASSELPTELTREIATSIQMWNLPFRCCNTACLPRIHHPRFTYRKLMWQP